MGVNMGDRELRFTLGAKTHPHAFPNSLVPSSNQSPSRPSPPLFPPKRMTGCIVQSSAPWEDFILLPSFYLLPHTKPTLL